MCFLANHVNCEIALLWACQMKVHPLQGIFFHCLTGKRTNFKGQSVLYFWPISSWMTLQAQQGASLNLTKRIAADMNDNITLLMHNGDLSYARGLVSGVTANSVRVSAEKPFQPLQKSLFSQNRREFCGREGMGWWSGSKSITITWFE